jgi:outer membrane protein TolC
MKPTLTYSRLLPGLIIWIVVLIAFSSRGLAQSLGSGYDPLSNTIVTPHPINPAANTTNPGALAAQQQNPFLGSVPECDISGNALQLSLNDAVQCGLRYNLGLIDRREGSATARAARMHALSVLLPQIAANAREEFLKYSAIPTGAEKIHLSIPGVGEAIPFPITVGPFNYQYTGFTGTEDLIDEQSRHLAKAAADEQKASIAALADSRDIVVLAVGSAYLQVVSSKARLQAATAEHDAIVVFDDFTQQRVHEKVWPEIDELRSQVARQTAEERVTVAQTGLAKDKLTLARIVGLHLDQDFDVSDDLPYERLSKPEADTAVRQALEQRSDLRSAAARLRAAEDTEHAQSAQRLPVLEITAGYGAVGTNPGNIHQTYSVGANLSIPIYTGGRIDSDIAASNALLRQRRAEYADIKGRVEYDVRNALFDLESSDKSVSVAQRNCELARRGLSDVDDRFHVGVSTNIEVVQAMQAVADADENYINSLFGYNVAKLDLARATGAAATNLTAFLKEK